MHGLMQDYKLVVPTIIDHAALNHADQVVVTRGVEDGAIRRITYEAVNRNARLCSSGLQELGMKKGDRIATMAWNTDHHLEAWYGIMGIGAVCHTVNPRLFPEQIIYIINHAEDRVVFTDTTFLPIFEKLIDQLPTVEHFIVLTDKDHLPETSLKNVHSYVEWRDQQKDGFSWVDVDENDACGLCYTSGTTGNPKGVLYSHRSNMVHGLIAGMKDAIGFGAADAILPVVPMFHANAWGIAFGAPMAGCKMVFPGMQMDGASIHELLETEQCTHAAAVPTVWLMLLQHLQSTGAKISTLKEVLIGGSAVPEKIVRTFLEDYGVETIHAWGMTEMSPIGTIAQPLPGFEEMSKEDQMAFRLKQGRTPWGVEMKIVDEAGKTLPRDGKTPGRLLVRGPAVVHRYFRQEDMDILDDEGYFDTGDMATIDRQGIMQITDRSKDVIKSGGEWISSIELENAAVTHPDVAEAAVIGLYHPKWDERPLLILVASGDTRPSKDDMVAFLSDKVAKWWLPDDVVYVDEIPHTATGKISKKDLRDQFKDYSLPTAV